MTWQTQYLFGIVDYNFLLFIFASTICSYGFHALVNSTASSTNNREKWNYKNRKHLFISILLSGMVVVVTSFHYLNNIFPILLAFFSAFIYSAPNLSFKPFIWLRKIAFGKTIYLALVWTYITAILPLWLQNQNFNDHQILLYVANRFFLVYAICILFDNRDLQADKIKGVKTITSFFSNKYIQEIYYCSLIASILIAVGINLDGKHLEENIYLIIAPIIGLLLYQKSTQSHGLFYDFGLDGLMMMAAILQIIHLNWLKFTTL
jgi:4-hydroxybenzoate polyprenyltransferase